MVDLNRLWPPLSFVLGRYCNYRYMGIISFHHRFQRVQEQLNIYYFEPFCCLDIYFQAVHNIFRGST